MSINHMELIIINCYSINLPNHIYKINIIQEIVKNFITITNSTNNLVIVMNSMTIKNNTVNTNNKTKNRYNNLI